MQLGRGFETLSWARPLVLAGALLTVALTTLHVAALLRSDLPADYGEGLVANYARLIEDCGEYALPIADPPWVHATYPPLVPLAVVAASHASGSLLRATRVVAVAGLAMILCGLVLLLRAHEVGRGEALLAVSYLLGVSWVAGLAGLGRVDVVAVGLSILGLASFLRLRDRIGVTVAAVLVALALLAKPTAVAAAVAIGVRLLVERRRRTAVLFAFTVIVLAGGGFWLWNLHSHGQALLHMTRYAGAAGFQTGPLAYYALGIVSGLAVVLPLAVAALVRSPLELTSLWALASLGQLAWLAKEGSNLNVILEPTVALVLLAAVSLSRLRAWARLQGQPVEGLLVLLVATAFLAQLHAQRLPALQSEWRGGDPGTRRVVSLLRATPHAVLVEDPGLAVASDHAVVIQPYQFEHLARRGLWNPTPLLDLVRRGAFERIVMGWRLRGIPGLARDVAAHYELEERVGQLEIWRRAGG